MNACSGIQESISEYIDGTLSKEREWRVRMHLSTCRECAQLARELQQTVSLLRSSTSPSVSPTFEAGLAAKLASVRDNRTGRPGILPRLAAAIERAGTAFRVRPERGWALATAGGSAIALVIAIHASYPTSMLGGHIAPGNRAMAGASNSSSAAVAALPPTDMAFVAACSSQHAQFASAKPIGDPSAQALGERLDDSRVPAGAAYSTSGSGADDWGASGSDTSVSE